jgi:drug/metabolite transporter (DMT)-like permease
VGLVGLLMFGMDYGLIYWAEQYLDSGLTAILFAVLPIATIMLAHLYLPGDRVTVRKLAGTVFAFLGVVALFGDRIRLDASAVGPMLAVLLSTVCAAVAGVAAKRHGTALHAAALNAPAMLLGGTVLMVASVLAGDGFRLPGDAATIGAVTYLALAGSVATFLVYFSLLKTWNVTSLSFISVFTPAIALLLGFLFRDERPTIWTGLGAALILAGVIIALTAPESAAPAPADAR